MEEKRGRRKIIPLKTHVMRKNMSVTMRINLQFVSSIKVVDRFIVILPICHKIVRLRASVDDWDELFKSYITLTGNINLGKDAATCSFSETTLLHFQR